MLSQNNLIRMITVKERESKREKDTLMLKQQQRMVKRVQSTQNVSPLPQSPKTFIRNYSRKMKRRRNSSSNLKN
jgi:hypothetical protein